eukprot:GAHX01001904.1.p1 GENE.GAHX01001904.1~~GAHX01001904.1.p1  ORF type:complete len:550 (-),score=61.14 GAHX01001904.1:1010-2626(-)
MNLQSSMVCITPLEYQCDQCHKVYKSKQSLKNHKSKHHNKQRISYKCTFCNHSSKLYLLIVRHITKKHSREHTYKTIIFYAEKQAKERLTSLVNNGKFSYIQTTGPKTTKKGTTVYYICNYKAENLKCNCFIIKETIGTKIKVTYDDNHNHEADITKIRICKRIKNSIINQISKGIPLKTLHKRLIYNFNSYRISKHHLITKNYLQYLRTCTKKELRFCNDDMVNTLAYLKSSKLANDLKHYIFKDKNTIVKGHCDITINFVLAFQTQDQFKQLQNAQEKYILADSTHGTNRYGYSLITFGVLTKKQNKLPILWIVTDSDSEKVVRFVLENFNLENLIPQKASLLMSDMSAVYINSWRAAINSSISWRFCQWHFKRADLKQLVIKEKDSKTRSLIKEKFNMICNTTDATVFNKRYRRLIDYVKKNSTPFHDYFIKYYNENIEKWATHHRLDSKLNTNMFVEGFHNSIKNGYLDGVSNNRLDHLVEMLCEYDSNRFRNEYMSTISRNKSFHGYREKIAEKSTFWVCHFQVTCLARGVTR